MGAATFIMLSAVILAGCRQEGRSSEHIEQNLGETADTGDRADIGETADTADTADSSDTGSEAVTKTEAQTGLVGSQTTSGVSQLEVRFGDNGAPFMMQLENNETAAAIARYVGTSDWRLPIYERDDDADTDVMQYYDVSSRYDIPSNPETITSEKAGEVYYSDPNRIVLFYHDAEITGEYTKIGTFDPTDDFVTAVEENPVLEGWGNKIVQIAQP